MLINILYNIITPVFLLLGLGFILDRKLRFDRKTLADLNFFVFVPALVFTSIIKSELSFGDVGAIGGFTVVHLVIMYLLGRLLYSFHYSLREPETVLSLSTIFYNAGNYGLPLVMLAFGKEHVGVIAVVLIVHNLLNFTVGVGLLEHRRESGRRMFIKLLKTPTIQAIFLAFLIRIAGLDFNSIEPLARAVDFLADGLIPVALLTLGSQLSRSRLSHARLPLIAVSGMRLLVSPLVATGLVFVFGIQAPISSILIVAAGLPVAVNVAILAGVYQQDTDLASQAVFWTTLISAFTITALLVIVGA